MTVDYQFTSFPTRSVTTTASDGRFRVAVSLPVDDVARNDWQRFEGSGFANPEHFINSHTRLKEKLSRSILILETALRQINTSNTALDSGQGFVAYGRALAESLRCEPGTESRRRKYTSVLRRFERFLADQGRDDVMLASLDSDIIDRFNRNLADQHMMATTIGFYNRILHAIYNTAVREGLVVEADPFANVEMNGARLEARHPRQLTEAELDRVFTADLTDAPDLARVRDILRVAYHTGLTFVQIVNLRHRDLTPDLAALLPGLAAPATPSPSSASPASAETTGTLTAADTAVAAAPVPASAAPTVSAAPDSYIFYPDETATPRPMARLRNDYFRAQQALAGRLGLSGLLSIPRVRHLSPRHPK